MTITRGFAQTKDQERALLSHGVDPKSIWLAGRGVESFERCFSTFRGRPGVLLVAHDLRVFGESRKAVAEVMTVLEGAGIGYARVSTEDQNLDVQTTALRDAGVEEANLYVEKISALNSKRPMFHGAMKSLERGDTLIVHALSRLGRDVQQIHGILSALERDGIAWRSITEPHLNNATAVGRLMLNITGAMAQFERDQIKDRTKRGMDELRRRGVKLGRQKLFDKKQTAEIKRDRKNMTREEVAAKWKCSPGTIDKYAA